MLAALVLLQPAFAQADGLGGDFHQFIIVDKFYRAFERKLHWCGEAHGFVGAAGAYVGEFFAFERIHHQVVVAAVDAVLNWWTYRLRG